MSPDGERLPLAGVARPALVVGVLTGLLEGGYQTVARLGLHRPTPISQHVVWMAPLTDAVLFVLVAVVAWLAARAVRRPLGPGGLAGLLAGLAAMNLLLLYPPLHVAAVVLLAIGAGVQVGRRAPGIARLGTVPAALALAVVALLAGTVFAVAWRREARSLAAAPAAAGRPSVLLLVLDTVRAKSLGLYGGPPTTPRLKRTAARGTWFRRAMAPSSWTLPSHAAMFTGIWPGALSTTWRRALDDRHRTLAEAFAEAGYATGGFVANLQYCGRQFGLDRGFGRYEDFVVSPGEFVTAAAIPRTLSLWVPLRRLVGYYDVLGRKAAPEVTDGFLAWLDRRGDRPFFAFLNYYDAHQPYQPPKAYERRFVGPTPRRLDLVRYLPHEGEPLWDRMSQAELRRERESYRAAINWLDDEVDRLLAELEQRGRLDNTIVVITSDHGEHFGDQAGDHGLFAHGNSLYRAAVQVPLVLFGPGIPAGRVVEEPVSLTDLAATLAGLAGLPGPGFPGRSLAGAWDGAAPAAPVLSHLQFDDGRVVVSVVADSLHYLLGPGPREELYHFVRDTSETVNLLPEAAPAVRARLRGIADSALRGHG